MTKNEVADYALKDEIICLTLTFENENKIYDYNIPLSI